MSDLTALIGAWRLMSFGITMVDTQERTEPFSPQPLGRMIMEPGGHIMFMFMHPERKSPQDDSDRAKLFTDMFAYSGIARIVSPGCLVTAVDLSWHPDWKGDQKRFFALDGDCLTIKTPEQMATFSDRLLVGDLVWKREVS